MANETENKEAVLDEQNRPEPPKDENGNPIAPPEGFRPPMGGCCNRPPKPQEGKEEEETEVDQGDNNA